MTLKNRIEGARGDAISLERLYRQVVATADESAFRSAIEQCAAEHPKDILYLAWVYRLKADPPTPVPGPEDQTVTESQTRPWWIAVAMSVVLGILYALFARGRPPVPIPGEADPLFWIGWGPLTSLGILFYLSVIDTSGKSVYRYVGPAVAVIAIALCSAWIAWGRTDHIAILTAIHLPLAAWAAIGVSLCAGDPDRSKQGYAFLVKSAETILTAGIYAGAGAAFLGLTLGIFAVLGIHIPERSVQIVAAWGIGAIPIVAVASAYDPVAPPAAQDRVTGLARILGIVTQLLLPLALAVLAVYVFWFIPAYFQRPFQEREVLIVYNATILAILVLMAMVVAGPDEVRSPRQDTVLHYAVLSLGVLTFLLNVYALAAILSRTVHFGLSPNRYAFVGWNIVTLIMLAVVVIALFRERSRRWVHVLHKSLARLSVLCVVWALWVLLVLPLSFG